MTYNLRLIIIVSSLVSYFITLLVFLSSLSIPHRKNNKIYHSTIKIRHNFLIFFYLEYITLIFNSYFKKYYSYAAVLSNDPINKQHSHCTLLLLYKRISIIFCIRNGTTYH